MKVIALLSGGLDSTVMADSILFRGDELKVMSVNYGQRHKKELEYAERWAKGHEVEHEIVDLYGLHRLLKGSSQTDEDVKVPEGHYAEESMKLTVVPNRNMIMLSIAAAWAISSGADAIAFAAHAGDHTIYPDCRPEFAQALEKAIGLADWRKVVLQTPFIQISKADIVSIGTSVGTLFSQTWSCYQGDRLHCGVCGTCVERKEAFELAHVPDPTVYR